jgi:hypothetical protein
MIFRGKGTGLDTLHFALQTKQWVIGIIFVLCHERELMSEAQNGYFPGQGYVYE